jgi:transposase
MDEISTIGFDLAKSVFQVHGVDATGAVTIRRQLRRAEVLKFFTKLPRCVVGMEACASAHHWAREIATLGHDVRLIAPIEVKPYVKRGRKNDATDAAAICEAVQRPHMQFVPIKTPEQQAVLMLHRARRLLVTQQTMLGNGLRAHLAEFGITAPVGRAGLGKLLAIAVDAGDEPLPQFAREALAMLATQYCDAETKIAALDQQIRAAFATDEASRRLAAIPGIGPMIASALVAAMGDPRRFKTGRHFAAWLGLVPSQNSSGGKQCLGRITKTGDRYLRSLLVVGATSILRRRAKEGSWLAGLLARMPARQATVALANKTARIAWAILAHGTEYKEPGQKAAATAAAA